MATQLVKLRNIKRALRIKPPSQVSDQVINYQIGGRVENFRTYKSINFIDLIDGSTQDHLQVVIKKDLLKKPELGSYLIFQGNIVPSPGSQQAIEFRVNKLNFIGPCSSEDYVLAQGKEELTDGWYRNHLHLRSRADRYTSLLRVRSELELGLHMIFKQMDFFRVHTPTLTANDSEASSDLFMVQRSRLSTEQSDTDSRPTERCVQSSDSTDDDNLASSDTDEDKGGNEIAYQSVKNSPLNQTKTAFDGQERVTKQGYFQAKNVFMTTSAQLHLECLAASLSRVYCLAPCFRAENSLSRRHLCEFQMLEAEETNLTQLEKLMDRVESIIKFSAQYLTNVSDYQCDFFSLIERNSNEENFDKMANSSYIRMTYQEALEILSRQKSNIVPSPGPPETKPSGPSASNIRFGCDISRLHERQLLDFCNNVPIFITNYPKELKPFYMKCDEQNRLAQCFDLIAPIGGEICGGSLREDDLDKLVANMQRLHSQQFDWYLDLRRFGSFPHGGFGIGFERLIQAMLGTRNIRDTLAFPRWAGHCQL